MIPTGFLVLRQVTPDPYSISEVNWSLIEEKQDDEPLSTSKNWPLIKVLCWTGKSFRGDRAWFEEKDPMEKCYHLGYVPRDTPCEFTTDRKELQAATALLFRGRVIPHERLPPRNVTQKWIFYESEPPHKTWLYANLTDYNGLFNLTATFTFDSDIPIWPHTNCIRNQEKLKKLQLIDFAAKKRRDAPVVWLVSRCFTQSKREEYVAELQKYIEVHTYGECGPLKCPSDKQWSRRGRCELELLHKNNSYKFYLAFENALCQDYVTEKLWKVMDLNVVVVVMGGYDYSRIMPPDSYIDARDFPSPRDLAKHLHYLDQDDEAYNQILRNKASLRCHHVYGSQLPLQCSICRKLHQTRKQTLVVHALDHFWSSRRCLDPKDFFAQKALSDFGFDLGLLGRDLMKLPDQMEQKSVESKGAR